MDDLNSGVSDLRRTYIDVSKATSSMVSYLFFEYEDAEMFESKELPTTQEIQIATCPIKLSLYCLIHFSKSLMRRRV